jgi:CheY-like chemotaxis protein
MSAFGKESAECGAGIPEKGKIMQALERIRGASALLVEDNEYNQLVASELLKSVGLYVTIAENGREALEKLGSRPFDVVLMDIQMPVMDGYEATRCIRANTALTSLPIIAMTAHAMASDRDKCLAVGMNDYVSKPIDPDALSAVLVTWVKPGVRDAADGFQPHHAVDADGEVMLPHTLPGVFVGAGLRMCNDNKKLYRDLLVRFKNDRYRAADDIRGALHGGDTVGACRIAHTMKSIAGTLGAKRLSESAEALEKAIIDGAPDTLALSLAAFDRCLGLVAEGLRAAFPDEVDRTVVSGAGGELTPAERLLAGQTVNEFTALLQSDIGQAMTKMETLRKLLPAGPLQELFGSIEQRMGEFDIDGVRVRLGELAGMLDLQEEH